MIPAIAADRRLRQRRAMSMGAAVVTTVDPLIQISIGKVARIIVPAIRNTIATPRKIH